MANPTSSIFFSYRLKVIGILLLFWAVISVFLKHAKYGIWDFELLAAVSSWGLCFIFFARERLDDERVHHLKFRALAWGIPAGMAIIHLINYFFLSLPEPDSGQYLHSISAYTAMAIILAIATIVFYFFKFREYRL